MPTVSEESALQELEAIGNSEPSTYTVGEVLVYIHRKLWYTMINEASPVGFDMTLSDD